MSITRTLDGNRGPTEAHLPVPQQPNNLTGNKDSQGGTPQSPHPDGGASRLAPVYIGLHSERPGAVAQQPNNLTANKAPEGGTAGHATM